MYYLIAFALWVTLKCLWKSQSDSFTFFPVAAPVSSGLKIGITKQVDHQFVRAEERLNPSTRLYIKMKKKNESEEWKVPNTKYFRDISRRVRLLYLE